MEKIILYSNYEKSSHNKYWLLTCGSLRDSGKQTGGAGGEGHSNEAYEPDNSHSLLHPVVFGGKICKWKIKWDFLLFIVLKMLLYLNYIKNML